MNVFLKKSNSRTPGSRHQRIVNAKVFGVSRASDKVKHNIYSKFQNAGRNHHGKITIYGRGGGVKAIISKTLPLHDFMRLPNFTLPFSCEKPKYVLTSVYSVSGKSRCFYSLFTSLESKTFSEFSLFSAESIAVGTIFSNSLSGEYVNSFKKGFVAPICQIPQNGSVFNVELLPGHGTKLARAAGCHISLQGADLSGTSTSNIIVKLPSGNLKVLSRNCLGQVGSASNEGHSQEHLGKAGRNRLLGRRPKVRGVAINPVDHPIGGGEGKTSGGRPSVNPQGWYTKGRRTVRKARLFFVSYLL